MSDSPIDPNTTTEWLKAGKAALDVTRAAIGMLPSGTKREEAEARLRDAEASLSRSDAQLAQQLGYKTCQCTFPPTIMLWREQQLAWVCTNEACKRTIVKPSRGMTAEERDYNPYGENFWGT